MSGTRTTRQGTTDMTDKPPPPDLIEETARYLQERSRVGEYGWDDITDRARALYRERATEIAAIFSARVDVPPDAAAPARNAAEHLADAFAEEEAAWLRYALDDVRED